MNRKQIRRARDGFSPFTCDLGGVAEPGAEAVITVRARDTREHPQPRGKQARDYAPRGAIYVRTTGIWQSVWLEPDPELAAGEESWGYGDRPASIEEFYDRFEKLCAVLLDNPDMFGYCYTQLTDIYQEQNGIYKFDRSGKFDLARLRAVQQRPAAIERRPAATPPAG